ncbi:MAG: hypothetical protein WA975_23545 [Mesorhizobium sp.]
MASDITITALTAVGMVGQIAATVMASSPASMSCLPYMQPAKVDIYIAATNNFASATLAGTVNSAVGVLMVDGLPELATRYLWAIPKDPDGNAGARYPAGGGVSVTTKATVPDGSVTGPKLADGAVTPTKMSVGTLSAITADFGSMTAGTITGVTFTGGVFRTGATGRRIEINGADNYLKAYDASGNVVATFGVIDSLNALVTASRTAAADTAIFVNGNVSGTALRVGGRLVVATSGAFNTNVMEVVNNDTSNNAHAARLYNPNTGGGHAVLGVSAGGGGYALNAQTGGVYSAAGYSPFTGLHEALVRKEADLKVGDIAFVKEIVARGGLGNVLTEVERADTVADRRVIGVVSEVKEMPLYAPIAALGGRVTNKKQARLRRVLASRYRWVAVNALGEGQMDVCGRGGDIGAGDYIITSDLPGKGQRLDMDQPVTFALEAAIVAQAMEPVTFDSPDQVRRVAVFYRCG